MEIDQSVNKSLEQVELNICCIGNGSIYGGGSSDRSNMTSHNCGKRGHIQKDYRSKRTGSSGKPYKKSTNYVPE